MHSIINIRFSNAKINDILYFNTSQERSDKMFYVSDIKTTAPAEFKTELQQKVYKTLDSLEISYERVDTDEAITMDDCVLIDEKLQMKMVKTLFLCNRQQTLFYLFVTLGDKPFRSKGFSTALEISRVSFAPAEMMDKMLGTKIGAATVFSALLPSAENVQIVFDREVLKEEFYGCSDGTTTGYMKIKTDDIINKFLRFAERKHSVIEV